MGSVGEISNQKTYIYHIATDPYCTCMSSKHVVQWVQKIK